MISNPRFDPTRSGGLRPSARAGQPQRLASQMTPPLRLYKYEALTTQSLLNLKRQIIYFGSPLQFNDPYDCALTSNIEDPSDSDLATIRQKYLNDQILPPLAKQQFETFSTQQLRETFVKAAKEAMESTTRNFLKTKGVACFSEKNNNLLMWSHYGGHYKGFCLEFATNAEPFSKINKVRYKPAPPPLSVKSILFDEDFHIVQELFCTKSEAWEYEAEWRAIHHAAGTQFVYPANALTGVYFGPDIDQQSLEIICLILAGQNESVRFWRGSRSTTEFSVLFEEFNYVSNLQAKKQGLAPS